MQKRERLEAVIGGEKPDRTPVALWRHWPGDDQDAAALAAAHIKWQQDFDWDLLKVGPSSSYSVDDWGVETAWIGHIEGTREYTRRVIERPEDWTKLQPLDPNEGMLGIQLEALRLIAKAVGDTTPIIPTIFSPLSQAKHLAGHEMLITHLRQNPEALRQGLDAIVESTLRFIEAARTTGISGIFYAVQHARYPVMSEAEFAQHGRGDDLRILEAVDDLWCNMLHVHGAEVMFHQVADYPAHFVNWHDRETDLSLAEGLTQIQGAASGGVNHWTLHEEAPVATISEAKDAIEQTNGRRLLLGTGCVAMVTTPLRNIRALRQVVETLA